MITFKEKTPGEVWGLFFGGPTGIAPLRFAEAFLLEVDRGGSLYTLVNELLRWRSLLDTRFVQHMLDKRRKKELSASAVKCVSEKV